MPSCFIAPAARVAAGLFTDADYALQRRFFQSRQDLAPTPLRALPARARELGIGALWIKDETSRFGLNAFKAAGATFAIAILRERGRVQHGDTLVCASEGNHGRAVARAAREAGCACRVYMAASVAPARVAAIESEGAQVITVAGTYDDAVRTMAREAADREWTVISDTSVRGPQRADFARWGGVGGNDEVPRLIMLGYTRLLDEAATQWTGPPDVILVPGGVGGLLGAVASWTSWAYGDHRPRVVAVEPIRAACLQVSARAGRPTTVHGPFDTVMGGLRCGEVSQCAFEAVKTIVDAYVAIEDEWAFEAMRQLARPLDGDSAIDAGASGAAAMGALLALMRDASLGDVRQQLGLGPNSSVLAIASEGVTEPELFARVVSAGQ